MVILFEENAAVQLLNDGARALVDELHNALHQVETDEEEYPDERCLVWRIRVDGWECCE
jgi:hypothetical protein